MGPASLYLPLILSAVFGIAAPTLAPRLPPQVATWLLSAGGLVAAAGSSATLGLMSFDLVAQDRFVAARGGWSQEVLRHDSPVSTWVGALASAAVIAFAIRFLITAVHRVTALRSAHLLAASLPGGSGELAVLHSSVRQAFAVPGRPGRIAVTTGMLRSLDGGQRRALLAHERSHLSHRHHAHHSAVRLAASVNPLLSRLPAAAERATERWADEDAAAVGRRVTVAAALAAAATGVRVSAPSVVLAAAAAHVAERVSALAVPAPRLTTWRVALPTSVLLATVAAVAVAMRDTERLFELAQHHFRTGTH